MGIGTPRNSNARERMADLLRNRWLDNEELLMQFEAEQCSHGYRLKKAPATGLTGSQGLPANHRLYIFSRRSAMRSLALLFLGVPIPIIILLWILL